jgi:hypothetical protein
MGGNMTGQSSPRPKRLAPMKNKKLNKKKRLENIRRHRYSTVIQAFWRGRAARKVSPLARRVNLSSVSKPLQSTNTHAETNEETKHDKGFHDITTEDKVESCPMIKPKHYDTFPCTKYAKDMMVEETENKSVEINEIEKKHAEELIRLAEKNEEEEANYIKQMIIAVIMLIAYFGFGMIFYSKTFKISYFQALYFSVVTVTTIGYGEITPSTDVTKIITSVNIFAGLATFTIAVTFLLDFFAKEKEQLNKMLIDRKFEEENKIEMDVKTGTDSKYGNVEDSLDEEQSLWSTCCDYIPELIRKALRSMFVAVAAIVVTVLIGLIFFMYVVEDFRFVDAVYFCSVTISSVGYGEQADI